jgi:hypothetical protein
MIKYYRVSDVRYEHGKLWISIEQFYLLKEGWIRCNEYREDPNDSYYVLDSTGTPGTRADYCVAREEFKDEEMVESLEKAKENALEILYIAYKNESERLLKAFEVAKDSINKIKEGGE